MKIKDIKKSIFVFFALTIFGVIYIGKNPNQNPNYHPNQSEYSKFCHSERLSRGIPFKSDFSTEIRQLADSSRNDSVISIAHAEEPVTDTGIVKGTFSEKIDNIDHQKEIYYGKSGLYNLDEMVKDLEVEIYPEDTTKTFPDPSLGIGSKIEILRANPVSVTDVQNITSFRTWAKNVRDLLSEKNIILGEEDRISPVLDTPISRDLEIKITRVGFTQIKETETIDYQTIDQNDALLERGITQIKQNGSNGIKEYTFKVRREDGEEVSRELINTEITKEPQDKIILHGTKIIVYGTGIATWYDWIGGMTAASNTLPYGTQVHVVNTANGKSVDVKIVDHGIQGSAIIDLSDEAFSQIGSLGQGTMSVRLEKP